MPKFIYTAKSFEGQSKSGEIVAQDEKTAALQLRADGFLATSLKLVGEKQAQNKVKFLDRFSTIPLKEKMVFARNLSIMVSSGLSVSKAIQNLSIQTKNKRFKGVLFSVFDEVQSGKSLSEALSKHPNVFNELFVNMVRVGESAGNLDEVLKMVASEMESENELISKVKGAMIYPAVIVAMMIGIGIIMLTYILPKITGIFEDMKVSLPPTTQFIVNLSGFMSNNKILVGISLLGLIIFGKIFLGTKTGKKTTSFLAVKSPIIKNISIKVNCARFARIYSSLLKSGVPVIESLQIASNTLSNFYYHKALKDGMDKVQKGITLSKILSSYPEIFPAIVIQMMEVGEETGKVDVVLLKLAEFYEEEVEQVTKNMSSVIEPVLMVIIGSAVGFFAVSMLQPMYSLMNNIN